MASTTDWFFGLKNKYFFDGVINKKKADSVIDLMLFPRDILLIFERLKAQYIVAFQGFFCN